MDQLSGWVGAGLVTAGVSAALLAGAGVASAETGSDSGGTSSSGSTSSDAGKPDSANDTKDPAGPKKEDDADNNDAPTTPPSSTDDADDETEADPTEADPADTDEDPTPGNTNKPATAVQKKKAAVAVKEATSIVEKVTDKTEKTVEPRQVTEPTESTVATESTVVAVAKDVDAQPVSARSATSLSLAQPPAAAAVAPAGPSLIGFVGSVIGAVVVNVGSIALTALQAVEALASGPPVLPPGSTVTVRSSWITLNTGQRVAANWYYPEVAEGDPPPDRMILLNHGFLALGPMYSYTAANLAERTDSIVVTPSIPSNFFLGDSYWLGGTGMASAIADLFVGDRAALTQSALDAGYATQYGVNPATATLPQKFGLAGHSLGGNLVPGVAGFLAENGAAENLVGVITLDGVPLGTTLPDALAKLDAYDAATPGDQFIPIREIGAPSNLFNSLSTLKRDLSSARPDRFTGVELTGGVHMDSMLGGNPLIQFAGYVAAGFPQPQNPPAVEELMVTWFDQWFEGDTKIGDDLVPGSTIDILNQDGSVAHGVVIGTPPAALELLVPMPFEPSAPTTLPELNPTLAVAV